MPVILAAAAAEDSRCAMVAPASFWRLGGGACYGAQRHWRPCLLCAAVEAIDPIRRSPFSPFPVRFTVLVLT